MNDIPNKDQPLKQSQRAKVSLAISAAAALAALCAYACGSTATTMEPNSAFTNPAGGPLIIAHRGGALEVPENTVVAISHGVSVGSDWQEIDVTLSSDGHVVVIHDDTVDRTTNGTGNVEAMTLAELTALTAGDFVPSEWQQGKLDALGVANPNFGDRYATAHVPTLAEVLAIPGSRLMIELKDTNRAQELGQAVAAQVASAKADDRVALGSFEFDVLQAAYQAAPHLPLIGIVDEDSDITQMLNLPIAVIAMSTDMVAAGSIANVPSHVAVWTWTVYRAEDAKALATTPRLNGLITDVPAAAIDALR